MSAAPRPLSLRKEDYRDASLPWLARLFTQLNDYFAAVTTALARGITRTENMRSVIKEVSFTTLATPANTFPIPAKHALGQRPTDVWVGQLRRADGAAITDVWSFTWEIDTNGDLSVRFQGLAASTAYEVRLILE